MISPPFELLSLPSVPSGKSGETVIAGDEVICLGVSHSSISSVSLRPPQVLSAHSVAPGSIVTAVAESNGTPLAYATKERSKFFLRLISGAHKEVSHEIADLYAIDDYLVVIYRNATIAAFTTSELTELWSKESSSSNKSVKIVFASLVDASTALLLRTDSDDTDNLIVSTVSFRRTGLSDLLESKISQTVIGSVESLKFAESTQDSTLYIASKQNSSLYLYSLPDVQLKKTITLSGEPTGVVALPNNNALVSFPNGLVLQLDCTFDSEVSRVALESDVRLLSYSQSASAAVAILGGTQVVGLGVSPTMGTLLESLGKGIQSADGNSAKSNEWSLGLAEIFGPSSKEFRKTAAAQVAAAQSENRAVLNALTACAEAQDGAGFSRIVTYLKSRTLTWDDSKASEADDLVYEETDRDADAELVRRAVRLCFGITPRGHLRYRPFVPQGVFTYFLTHPLFPNAEAVFRNGALFKALSKRPRLYRQAVVTLPGIDPVDLVVSLLNADADIFGDAVTRLVEEFGQQQILDAIRQAFKGVRSLSALQPLVERLSKRSDAWPLVLALVDSIGLLGWDAELVKRLLARTNSEIEYASTLSRTDAVLVDAFQSLGIYDKPSEIVSVVGSGDVKKQKLKKQKQALAAKEATTIPRYSVEPLILN